MITLPMGILLFGLGVLGLAVATAIHDTWWLQRKIKEVADHQDFYAKPPRKNFSRVHRWFTDKKGASMAATEGSLYIRLGGYDAIAAVVDDLQVRLENDPLLGRYWSARRSLETDNGSPTHDRLHRGSSRGAYLLPRTRHATRACGHGFYKDDYTAFTHHLTATLDKFKVPEPERGQVLAFIASLESQIVEK